MNIKEIWEYFSLKYPEYHFDPDLNESEMISVLIMFFSDKVLGVQFNENLLLTVLKLLRLKEFENATKPNTRTLMKEYSAKLRINPLIDVDNGFLQITVNFLALKGIVDYKSSSDWWWITDFGRICHELLERWYIFKYIMCIDDIPISTTV